MLRKKGLLVSIFTNACLVTPDYIELFERYPPRDIEITVYGVTEKTYDAVTRKPGSFNAFQRGLNLLLDRGIPVQLKTMAIKTNVEELPEIASFCRQHSKNFFRFDPQLHLRFDKDEKRNLEIIGERLSPEKIAEIEHYDRERSLSLKKKL